MNKLNEIVVIGAGGLGTPAAWGIVENYPNQDLIVTILDGDKIELSNLNRQVLFDDSNIGGNKAEVLVERLTGLEGRKCELKSIPEFISNKNISIVLQKATFVIDACDNVSTKFLINDYCVKNKIPFCYAGVIGFKGQALMVSPHKSACLRCLFGADAEDALNIEAQSCHQAGIVGPIAGALGFLQAEFAIQFLNGNESNAAVLYRYDFENASFTKNHLNPSTDCPLGCAQDCALKIRQLDLTTITCPKTFLYTKLALEELSEKEALEVTFSNIISFDNVKNSIVEEGYEVVTSKILSESKFMFVARR